ncbi:staygreen family protein [Lederbergia citrea]|uniref:Staygreen protein domain-containing protein n=1 Tax=Lederbergia citrea TaxID=2833581 RepID=A0A942UI28_9BACI|nr:staygreen family protein [Lederbergia citrea]MBS4176891.1 hypothetical protein [Lederbergia citrea]MBS4221860.1 hypothetical protein [Lederbergia citrea]
MIKLQSNHFTVMVIPPATSYGPVDSRKYTLSNSNSHSTPVLTISTVDHKVANNEDMLTAEWMPKLGEYVLSVKINVGGEEITEDIAEQRFQTIHSMLPEMLSLIIKSDYALFKHVPWLLDASIYVQNDSCYPRLCTLEKVGTPRKYLNGY